MNLYKRILGEDWNNVHPLLVRLHSGLPAIRAECTLRITNGPHLFARVLARATRLPAPTPSALVTLTVRAVPNGECWERAFPDCRVTTFQSMSGEGHLIESYGIVVLWFRLAVREGGIDLHHVRTFVRIGSFLLTLHDRLAPRIRAREEPSADGTAISVAIGIDLPYIGEFVSYEGIVRVQN